MRLLIVSIIAVTGIAGAAKAEQELFRGQTNYDYNLKDLPRGISVNERARPDLEAPAIKAGSFTVAPKIGLSYEYNDNIFFTETNEEADSIVSIAPSIVFASDWSRHSLLFRAGALTRKYVDNESQDYTDAVLGLNGAFDIARNFYIASGASWQRLHLNFDSPNNDAGIDDKPTEYELSTANLRLVRDVGKIGFEIGATGQNWDYDDNNTRNNDDRDRDDLYTDIKLSYRLKDDYKVYTKAIYGIKEYSDKLDDNGFERSSDGLELLAGLEMDLSQLITADIYAGYLSREYDDARFNDVDAFVYGVNALWSISPLTSLRGTVSRGVTDSIQSGIPAYLATRYALELEHELRRNLLLSADLGYGRDKFYQSDRRDDLASFGMGAEYLLNPHAVIDLSWDWNNRDSSSANQDFDQNSVLLSLDLKY